MRAQLAQASENDFLTLIITFEIMSETTYNKLELAIDLLDEAVRQFLDRKSFACSLNLAGVAEEVLGKAIELRGNESSLAQRIKDHIMIHDAFGASKLTAKQSRFRHNQAKNSIKHLNDTNDMEVILDLEDEAIDMLSRAVQNVFLLQLPYTEEIRRFDEWYMKNCVGS